MGRTMLALLAVGVVALSGCSVSITATQGDDLASGGVEATAEAAPNESEQAQIDQEYYNFCATEATNNVDFIADLGDFASDMITDGIAQSISQQALDGVQAESCKQAWIDVMTEAGIEYVDPDGAAPAASATPEPSGS